MPLTKKIALVIAAVASYILYYSGFILLVQCLRRGLLKKYHCVILGYHSIAHSNPHYRDKKEYVTDPSEIEGRLRYLLRGGYASITLDDIIGYIRAQRFPPRDCFAVTFDDGYEDVFVNALPLLRRYRIPATFFVITRLIGTKNYLGYEQIKSMHSEGFVFGSHTESHPRLTAIKKTQVFCEAQDSKSTLESILGEKIRYFSYPHGSYNQGTITVVREAGYEAAVTIREGVCSKESDVFLLPRKQILKAPFHYFACHSEGLFDGILNWLSRQKFWSGDSA